MKSDACTDAVTPSHGEGRRFDPFSAHHSTGVSVPSVGSAEQFQAEQSKSGRGADVEVCSTSVHDIPTEPKAFSHWLFAQKWMTLWPADLIEKADRLYQSMVMSDHASEAWRHSPATRRSNLADWSAFTTAYAEHKAREAV